LNHRLYLTVGLVELSLLWGGFAVVVGMNKDGNRLLGVAALLGGLVLLVPTVAYLRRPKKPRPPETTLLEDLSRFWSSLRKRR
jgi:hypothetical protein